MIRAGLVIAALAALAGPAEAGYVHATWSSTIAKADPAAPKSLAAGQVIAFDVVYDPDRQVDRTAGVKRLLKDKVSMVGAVSLSDDPKASLTITIGGVKYFTKADELQYGTPFGHCDLAHCGPEGLGAGNLPALIDVDGRFGVGNIFVNADGYTLDADPIADLLTGGFGLDGPHKDQFDIYIGKGSSADPFAHGMAVANIDKASFKVEAVDGK